ncbi:MAG: GntR family transcriptional regulator [Candidatus Neomarinimicrobiota bacterium]|jgi:GntR family transcriptional regulator|nr:GntR family transcriptional regulator [Eubacteriales bacterium]MDX9780085.1 GntR family transcriptional regulator [bacterium]
MGINFDSERAIYLQLADLIREAIISGELRGGEAVPSVRQLSSQYRLNPQTILNATQLLVNEGLLEKRRGRGYYVTAPARESLQAAGYKSFAEQTLPELVRQAKMLGIGRERLVVLIEKVYEEE